MDMPLLHWIGPLVGMMPVKALLLTLLLVPDWQLIGKKVQRLTEDESWLADRQNTVDG